MKKIILSLIALPAIAFSIAADAVQPTEASVAPVFRLDKTIAIGGEARWDYLYADSTAHRLYVSHGTQTEVVDTDTDKVVATIPDTIGVHGIAIADALGKGFISDGKADSVTVFDLTTLKTLFAIKVGANPDAIVYVKKSNRVVTFNGRSKDATVIDAKSGKVIGTVVIGHKPEFAQVDNAGNIYFNVEDSAELAVLDPLALKLTRRVSLKPCDSPTGLAIDEQQRLYSVCENKMMIISAPDGRQLAQVGIGRGPDGVAWMDNLAFSANGEDGNVSVVRETMSGKFETVATIPTQTGARTIAADPATHKLYLPVSDFKAGEKGGKRQGIADTFRVLVIDTK